MALVRLESCGLLVQMRGFSLNGFQFLYTLKLYFWDWRDGSVITKVNSGRGPKLCS